MNFSTRIQRYLKRNSIADSNSLIFPAVAFCLVGLLSAVSVAATPFDNGFEDTNSDDMGDFGGWEFVEAETGEVVIVEAEGPAQFPVYDDLNVESVEPANGDFMLRMGTPKSSNETQPRGVNRIFQTFTATSEQISVALRLFSIDHRGDDILRISLTADDGANTELAPDVPFDLTNGTVCTVPSCDVVIDVGKRKDDIATGWQVIRFSDLEPDTMYTLTIELEAGQNESLASWLYVDGVNEAPTAVINLNPGNGNSVEGDFVVFDCLDSVDPEGSELSCKWTMAYSDVSSEPVIGPTVVYWFPDDGSGTVFLEVSDGEEAALADESFTILDQAPLVNALNVEVLPGGSVELLCRYADPGVTDRHTVSFSVASGSVEISDEDDENIPAMSSGYARAIYQAEENAAGTVSGACSAGGIDDTFNITILGPDDIQRRIAGTSGSTVGAPWVNPDQSILGWLQDPNQIAVYELVDRFGNTFSPGTEVVVTAQVPVDYDIAILSSSADPGAKPWASAPFVSAPFVSAPFVSVPFVSAPFVSAPFVSAPFVSAPFVSAPFVSAPFVSAPFVSAPFVSAPLTQSLWLSYDFLFENIPLSQLAGSPDGSNISGVDIAFGDLGALTTGDLADEPVFLKGLSAEFGTNPEQLLVEVGPGENGLYVAVIPQAGSFSSAPFSLQVEAAIPPPTVALLGDACIGDELVLEPGGFQRVSYGTGEDTLIVTQKERMIATFWPDNPEQWDIWIGEMSEFFTMVNATVISVPSDIFIPADTNPCVVEAQNELASQIKAYIDAERTGGNLKYVQLMGSLDIVPPYYVPDETQTGNESLFKSDLLTQHGTPLGVAISEGYMLTDAFYVDADPQPFNGRKLYLEDISVSRLVETPDEILANAERFVHSRGMINVYTTQSTGYDFFIDGTNEVNAILQGLGVPNTTRNDDTWDAKVLRCQFFGRGCDANEEKPVSELNVVNMHMSYNAGLTAKGFDCQYLGGQDAESCANTSELGEVILSRESAGIYDVPDGEGGFTSINGVTFSIGCHSGLSVPDAWGLPEELGLPIDPARDWVQELGTWVGSYNFAYGDTDVADRGTEGILTLVIANFTQGMPLGEALLRAKWEYGAGLFEFGVYDEKSLVGLNLFGMPQATLDNSVAPGGISSALASSAVSTATAGGLVINYLEEGSWEEAGGSIDQHLNAKGTWYSIKTPGSANGKAQGIVGRPLLPVIKPFELLDPAVPLRPISEGGTSVHGVALRGGTYTVYLDQNPVFPAQTHDLVTRIFEPQPCVETLSPSLVALVNRFDSPEGILESFIVQPGQFQCKNPEASQVEGDFRIWNTMQLELLHPTSSEIDDDLQPPEVTRQDLVGDPSTGIVKATLDALDDSGIREVIALVYRDDDGQAGGTGTAEEYSLTERNGEIDGLPVFELTIPNAFDKLLSFQYIDGAGNITAKTLKGALLRAIEVSIETSFITLGSETLILVEIGDFCSLVAPYVTIDFGDGDREVIELDDPEPPCLDSSEGSRTIEIFHTYDGKVDPVTIEVEVRASGAVGTDTKTISSCSDIEGDAGGVFGADIIGCSISPDGGSYLKIGVVIAEGLSNDVQYRLILPQTNTQIKWTVDGGVTGPKKIRPEAEEDSGNVVTFRFDAGKLGWDGESPFEFLFETQQGVSGGQGQGFVDETDVKIYQP